MASAFVLYLSDSVVGPALELIRRICEPGSKSLPHITVRAPIKRLPREDLDFYFGLRIREVCVVGPGSFGLDEQDEENPQVVTQVRKTVYLRCTSDALEFLSHKPEFPDSVFHLTLYDGRSESFARELLNVLCKYPWRQVVSLPADTKLTEIPIGSSRPRRPATVRPAELSVAAQLLFSRLAPEESRLESVLLMSDADRLELVRRVCEDLSMAGLPTAEDSKRESDVSVLWTADSKRAPTLWSTLDGDQDDEEERAVRWPSHADRQELGLFLTPPELALDVATAALQLFGSDEIDFGDPALGSGVFFAALLQVVAPQQIRSATGVEIEEGRARLTSERWGHRGLSVVVSDFLDARPSGQRNFILANPPYIRYQMIDAESAARWRAQICRELGVRLDGRTGLYVYFILFAHQWLAEDGVSAWLVPSEFLSTKYGAVLRDYLTSRVELLRMHLYDNSASRFENALVSSIVIIFRKRSPVSATTVRVTVGGMLAKPSSVADIPLAALRDSKKWVLNRDWSVVVPDSDSALPRLGDLFRVKRGIATGANSWFVLSEERVKQIGIQPSFLKPLIPKSRFLTGDIIEADADGGPVVTPRIFLLDSEVPLAEIRHENPSLARYLDEIASEVGERTLVRIRRPFYRQDVRLPPRFFCSYMAQSHGVSTGIRFFLNRSRAVILNHYLALYPTPRLQELIDSGLVAETEILRSLNSISSEDIDTQGRRYVRGLQKIEPRELERVLLRHLSPAAIRAIAGSGGE